MFRSLHVVVLSVLVLPAISVASPPTPSGSADVTLGVWYSPDPAHLPQVALDLAGSAEVSIFLATSRLTDAAFVSDLCTSATNSVAVHVAVLLPSSTTSAGWVQARRVVASGGTVTRVAAGVTIPSSFVVADGVGTVQGPYYFSPTAVQAGSYLMLVSGTHSAAVNVAKFASLISGGTNVVAAYDRGRLGADVQQLVGGSLDARFTCYVQPSGCTSASCLSSSGGGAGCDQALRVPPPPVAIGPRTMDPGARVRGLRVFGPRIRQPVLRFVRAGLRVFGPRCRCRQ